MSYFCPEKFWFSSDTQLELSSNAILKQLNDNLDPEKKKQGWKYVFVLPLENEKYFDNCFKLVRFTFNFANSEELIIKAIN